MGGRREPIPHWAWLTLFPRGRLGDGAWRDHVQEVLPLAVHGRRGLVHRQAGADKRKGPACNRTEGHAAMTPVGGRGGVGALGRSPCLSEANRVWEAKIPASELKGFEDITQVPFQYFQPLPW